MSSGNPYTWLYQLLTGRWPDYEKECELNARGYTPVDEKGLKLAYELCMHLSMRRRSDG